MPIQLKNRRQIRHYLDLGIPIFDLTSKGPEPWVKFSPFFPHGGIPIPLSPGWEAQSVEGIWQGLKVFESEGIDPTRFANVRMKGLKRTFRKYGTCLGHRAGVEGDGLLDYLTARRTIFLPAYQWVLENKLQAEVQQLRDEAAKGDVIFLDYETNSDVADLRRPLSHAGLVIKFLEDGGF